MKAEFVTKKRTSIVVPVLNNLSTARFRVTCSETGEIWECDDAAPLLRYIAKNIAGLQAREAFAPKSKAVVGRLDETRLTYRFEVVE